MPTKAALRALGFAVGQCRLPLGDADEALDVAANDVVSSLQAQRG
jgi:dihydrodipicolinate synthase/N-acetylneuraminate lyase